MYKLIDGKIISSAVKERVKNEVAALKEKGITTGLAVIIVGEDPASKVYVNNKKKACEALGIISEEYALPETTTQEELLSLIDTLNKKESINGILCQLPLPKHLDEGAVINAILPEKDVDAFHPVNVGKIMQGDYDFVPCTPAGIMEMLQYENIDITGKSCVVIGRSNTVGKPMSMLLLHKNGTVTICHSRTQNLAEITRQADVIIAAVGKPGFLKPEMVKEGAVIVDVGINAVDGKIVGDVAPEVEAKASAFTPVPGGVGVVCNMMLMDTLTRHI